MNYPASDFGLGALGGIIAGFFAVAAIIGIAIYIFMGLIYYKLFKKADVNNPWLAWVPIGNLWPLFDTVKLNRWHMLWIIAPAFLALLGASANSGVLAFLAVVLCLAPIVVGIIITIRLYRAFGISLWWLLLYVGFIIPIISTFASIALLVLLCYMAFSSSVQYNPNFNHKNGNGDGGPTITG